MGFTTGAQFARRLGWSPSRVSKLETGQRLPRDEELEAWIATAGLADADAAALREALAAVRTESAVGAVPARVGRETEGFVERHLRRVSLDLAAQSFVQYAPSSLPDVVATSEYLAAQHEAFVAARGGSADGAARLEHQRIRHQEVLFREEGRIVLVIEESALRDIDAVGADVQARQLHRLLALTELPALQVEVCPSAGPAPSAEPASVTVHDETSVLVRTALVDRVVSSGAEVERRRAAVQDRREGAERGDAAIDRIRDSVMAIGDLAHAASPDRR